MKKNKILQLIPYLSSQYGGPPYVAKSLNNLLIKHGYESKILTVGKKYSNEKIVSCKLTTALFFFSFEYIFQSIKYIKNSDVIFIHGLYTFISLWGSIVAFVLRKKVFLLPHGMLDKNSVESSNLLKNSLRKLYLYSFGLLQVKCATKLIFNSMKELDNSIFNNNSIIIPNGVDLNHIDSIKCFEKYFDENKISLFFFGRVNHIKGVDLLLEAIDELDDKIKEKIELVIAGTGSDSYLNYLINRSDKKIVKLIGHIESDEKYCYLKQCDIYLQPSMTEGLSISMLEAMACRVNMVTTDKVGLFEELMLNNAAKVISYDKLELKNAILAMIKQEMDFKNSAYRLIKEKYDWSVIVKNYIKLIGEK